MYTEHVEKEGKARILAVQTLVSRGSRTMSQQGKKSKHSVLPDPKAALDHTSKFFRYNEEAEKQILDLYRTWPTLAFEQVSPKRQARVFT